jgi:two-component sensor histidine kinase/tetratricopeptide (TPR) repeat protein
MNRTILITLLLLSQITAYTQYYTKEEGTVLLNELRSAKSDSARISLLVKVAEYHTMASYDHPSNFDTAKLLIAQAEALNAKAKLKFATTEIMMAKSFFFRATGRVEDGKNIILEMISMLKGGQDNTSLGKAYYELSNYYDYDFKYNTIEKRIAYIRLAIAAFEKSGALNDLGNCYKVMADLHHLVNEYARAMDEIEISLKYYKMTHYKRLEGVYDMYGQLFYARGDYKQALAYELMALKTANANVNGGLQICEIENNVGLTLYKLNDAKAALPHFKNALAIAQKDGDNETVYGLTSHVVEAYVALQQPREGLRFLKSIEKQYKKPATDKFETQGYIYKTYLNLYTILGEYGTGRFYCNQLIIKSKDSGLDVFKLNGYYEEIIKYLIATREFPAALKYLHSNKALLERINDNIGLSRNYGLWFSLDTTQGNYRSAVDNILKAKLIDDTILNTAKTNDVRQLEVQYETEKKENDIRLKDQTIKALVQTDLLRQINLNQAKFTRNLMLVTSILLLTLGGFLALQYKQKRKANIVITQRNEQLGHLLKEKEWLVKEVHHRVKNNLQMVISLLNTQSTYLDNDAAIMAIRDSQRRMQAMSLIHQKLYQSKNFSVIDMQAYISELITYLKEIFDTASGIHFEQDIEPVKLDVSQAVPVGLILNEVITNAIKYAFDQTNNAIIKVSLYAPDPHHLHLTVSDNGKGLPENFHAFEGGSLGMSLVTGLVKQLEGSLQFLNDGGVKLTIVFPYDKDRIDLEAKS